SDADGYAHAHRHVYGDRDASVCGLCGLCDGAVWGGRPRTPHGVPLRNVSRRCVDCRAAGLRAGPAAAGRAAEIIRVEEAEMIALLWPLFLGAFLSWAMLMIADAFFSAAEDIEE